MPNPIDPLNSQGQRFQLATSLLRGKVPPENQTFVSREHAQASLNLTLVKGSEKIQLPDQGKEVRKIDLKSPIDRLKMAWTILIGKI